MSTIDYENIRILTNRDYARAAKRVKVWCNGCDANLVSDVGKCEVCGTRNKPNKIKDKGIDYVK